MKLKNPHLLLLCMVLFCAACGEKEISIRGIYGSPRSLWNEGIRLDDYAINAVFVYSGAIDSAMINRARDEGARVYSEFATLNGKGYVEKHPEAWPINERGEREPAATWFMGVCPTDPGFKAYRMKLLRELITKFDLAGIWMDYVHWHAQFEDPEPILPETCFCDNCLASFEADTGIDVPDGSTAERAGWILDNRDPQWRDWRCSVIVDWARDMKTIIREIRPDALLGVYHCPWDDAEFDGARRRILGLDFGDLAGVVDAFSPMVYHGRMGRKPEWVEEYVGWFCRQMELKSDGKKKVWPIVQAHDEPYEISADEFETVLLGGVTGTADGVMMFTVRSIAESYAKAAVLKRIYNEMVK
ncbi:hypothetical protein ACFLT7_05635 [candidate division KSB1 bacterium]